MVTVPSRHAATKRRAEEEHQCHREPSTHAGDGSPGVDSYRPTDGLSPPMTTSAPRCTPSDGPGADGDPRRLRRHPVADRRGSGGRVPLPGIVDALDGLHRDRFGRVAVIRGGRSSYLQRHLPGDLVLVGLYGLERVQDGQLETHPDIADGGRSSKT